MILRQFVVAIRQQDWLTVTIEFAIVVAGVFLGLQANDWAVERDNRQQEQAALERLLHEFQSTAELLDELVQLDERNNRIRRAAIGFIDSDDPLPADDLMLRVGINTLGYFPPLNVASGVYEELVATGQMQLLRSASLRQQLAEFHSRLREHSELAKSFREADDLFWPAYREHVVWRYNSESETSDILISSFNWDSMRQDRQFIMIAIGALRNQLVIQQSLVSLSDQSRSVCRAVADLIGQRCEALD